MPNTKLKSIAMSILAAGLFVAAQSCSSSSSSGNNVMASCMEACTKEVPCLADAGVSETMAMCVQTCLASIGAPDGGTCTNQSAIDQAAQTCAAKTTCADLEACGGMIPKCQVAGAGGTGTGGTSGTGTGGTNGAAGNGGGTGGTSGAGGAGATANCSVCDKAHTCCVAVMGATSATCTALTAATCSALPAANQAQAAMACQSFTATYPTNSACQ